MTVPSGSDTPATPLDLERAAASRIVDAHRRQVDRSRRFAEGLAAEASSLSEEGPRETEAEAGDEDIEAAAETSAARAAAARAVLAYKRVRELERAGEAEAFGRITGEKDAPDGGLAPDADETIHIGRMSVVEDDEVLLVDWRAPAAEPFYRATALQPLGVSHRRHLHWDDGTLVDFSDEVFDTDALDDLGELRGEAALLRTLSRRTDDRMQTVVATIQAEQDTVVRASAKGPLLVQGGPGTGKTVVALHRAAYLLYADRAALAETGVLIVGPSPQFLLWISDVLPSLGESGVISVTPAELYPGVRLAEDPDLDVATLKGDARMAALLGQAVRDRRRRPTEPLIAWYGSRRLRVETDVLQKMFDAATRWSTHNAGAGALRRAIVDTLVDEVFEPGFGGLEDIRASIEASEELALFCERHWPVLTPEQALNDLLGSPALLSRACRHAALTEVEEAMLAAPRLRERALDSRTWHHADVPLLDELLHLLGDVSEAVQGDDDMEHRIADETDVFEAAEATDVDGDSDDDEDEIDLDDDPDADVESFDAWGEDDVRW